MCIDWFFPGKGRLCNENSNLVAHLYIILQYVKPCMASTTASVPFLFGLFYNIEYIVVPSMFSCAGAGPFRPMCDTTTRNTLNVVHAQVGQQALHTITGLSDGQRHALAGPALYLPLEYCSHTSCTAASAVYKPSRELYIKLLIAH